MRRFDELEADEQAVVRRAFEAYEAGNDCGAEETCDAILDAFLEAKYPDPLWTYHGGGKASRDLFHELFRCVIDLIPDDARVCKNCGGELPDQRPNRLYCHRRCLLEWNENRAREVEEHGKDCAICGTRLERRKDESASNYLERETCSRKCGDRLRARAQRARVRRTKQAEEDKKAPCPKCGERLLKHRQEPIRMFRERTVCMDCEEPAFRTRQRANARVRQARRQASSS